MSTLIYRLNGVDNEEAQEVRDIFEEHAIDYYETEAGRWGISVAALWLIDHDQLPKAKELLTHYQEYRLLRIKQTIDQDIELYKPLSIKERFFQYPLHYSIIILAILAVTAFSTLPFLSVF